MGGGTNNLTLGVEGKRQVRELSQDIAFYLFTMMSVVYIINTA